MTKFKAYQQGQQAGLFPLDISSLIPDNHLVRRIREVIERINNKKLEAVFSKRGASAYHPKMMLAVIIYAYATKNYSCRNIAAMLRQDITYMWLAGMQTPDFNTVNRFRSDYLKDVIEDVFAEVLLFLSEHNFIKFETYFVDGTKLEADANKYSHVWKKNTERYKAAVQKRVAELMEEIDLFNKQENKLYDNKDLPELGEESQITSDDVDKVAQALSQKLAEKEDLKKSEKRKLEGKVRKLSKEKENLQKYEQQEKILGDRNSYSKTDEDATMMRMKGTEELRPGYNVLASSESQFLIAVNAGQNASDSASFPEHVDVSAERGNKFLPNAYVGDCGFGSEENYQLLENKGVRNYLMFPSFHREMTEKYKSNIFHKDNFIYNAENDTFICPNNSTLIFKQTVVQKSVTGFEQTLRVYEGSDCSACQLKEKCTKSDGNRTIRVNENLERHKEIARKNLTSEDGQQVRKRRGFEIETFFGDLKHNQKYKRIRLRGLEKANLEMKYLGIAYNLRKATLLLNKVAA